MSTKELETATIEEILADDNEEDEDEEYIDDEEDYDGEEYGEEPLVVKTKGGGIIIKHFPFARQMNHNLGL